ncbi:heavy metal-binding domain-containing protein [Clostridium sp. B9]|uniref:heavy metal-binding domain-containing protein n=1 Tax=Clostridium sp. B9 TaxID=3423224 RepID=UPI003D2F3C45
MLILTTESIPGKEIKEIKGLVKGSTVRCKNIGRDITSSFKNLVGGEMNSYNEMLTEARQIAIGRMVDEAEALGANAIIGMRLMSSSVAAGAAEMVAYGTAVVYDAK